MMAFLETLRHWLGLSSALPAANAALPGGESLAGEQVQRPATDEAAAKGDAARAAAAHSGQRSVSAGATAPAGVLSAYLSARAEETLALLLEGLGRQTADEVRLAVAETGQGIASEIAGVRNDGRASQREMARLGRELVRAGATLETIQTALSAIAPAMGRLEDSLLKEMARVQTGAAVELAGTEEILATLDGLEIGLQEGREMVSALASVQDRLRDETVQRWWRAMAEATGVKRPLPDLPLEDLESLVAGLGLTYRRLQDALARHGVKPIEAVGRPFDPYLHEAAAVEPCREGQDGLVLREHRRGYCTSDRVLRLAQVVVGRAQPAAAGEAQPIFQAEESSTEAVERTDPATDQRWSTG